MSPSTQWAAAGLTIAVLVLYEVLLLLAQRRRPTAMARTAHAALREEWLSAISRQPGTEILAVQTLRNSLMSATMTASTALLGLMGTVTLAAPSLHASFDDAGARPNARLLLELMLLALLFASLICSVMAARYYNHAGYIASMPVGSAERERWRPSGATYLRRAGVLYGWGLRHLVIVAPLVAAILHPLAGPVAAVIVVSVLYGFDRVSPS